MANPLHELLPPVDLSFGIRDIVGAIALLVSAFTFYIAHTQASQSEQIKISRELCGNIKPLFDRIEHTKVPKRSDDEKQHNEVSVNLLEDIFRCLTEIDYFAYLIIRGEIKDNVVLDYYRKQIIKSHLS